MIVLYTLCCSSYLVYSRVFPQTIAYVPGLHYHYITAKLLNVSNVYQHSRDTS